MAGSRNGVLHSYTHRLTAFEHIPKPASVPAQNLVIFIGGLFDGLLTVPYPSSISDSLPSSWSLVQVLLSSSYTAWGTCSLQRDVKELSRCVSYFRTIRAGKIVLMGHSTGCQDVMEYLTGKGHENRAPIDGAMIQAPVSDRESLIMSMDPVVYEKHCKNAQAMVERGEGDEIVPGKPFPCPVTATRWLSLASPNHDGDDDYFSSDLTDDQLMRSFGALPARSPLCILYSGSDEYVPKYIDKDALVKRWISISRKGNGIVDEKNSGIIDGATHNLAKCSEDVVNVLVQRVLGFLNGLVLPANL